MTQRPLFGLLAGFHSVLLRLHDHQMTRTYRCHATMPVQVAMK